MDFEEYQLSPGLISLSLQSTAHPLAFQRYLVRAFTQCYLRFALAMDRSPGFGSTPPDIIRAINTRFPYGYGTNGTLT